MEFVFATHDVKIGKELEARAKTLALVEDQNQEELMTGLNGLVMKNLNITTAIL